MLINTIRFWQGTDADSKAAAEAHLVIALTNNVIETHVVKVCAGVHTGMAAAISL